MLSYFNENIWSEFKNAHYNNLDANELSLNEYYLKFGGEDITLAINNRENTWTEKNYDFILNNLQSFTRRLEDTKIAEAPITALKQILQAIISISKKSVNSDNLKTIIDIVKEIESHLKELVDTRLD